VDVHQPIACSLDAADRRSRLDEWQVLLSRIVTAIEWPGANRVSMRLSEGAPVETLVALAQQEVACCPFFVFSIEIDAQGIVFTASVPPDAVPVLEGFARLATC
jgi:MerR family copper efflux transcriptional regulator